MLLRFCWLLLLVFLVFLVFELYGGVEFLVLFLERFCGLLFLGDFIEFFFLFELLEVLLDGLLFVLLFGFVGELLELLGDDGFLCIV